MGGVAAVQGEEAAGGEAGEAGEGGGERVGGGEGAVEEGAPEEAAGADGELRGGGEHDKWDVGAADAVGWRGVGGRDMPTVFEASEGLRVTR